ncbi:hypothetical protein TP38_00105, partial [Xanthomonas citri pv. citri]
MNSNIPNSPDERIQNHGGDEQHNGDHNERNNPYFARQQASAEPDLDLRFPHISSCEIKRLVGQA